MGLPKTYFLKQLRPKSTKHQKINTFTRKIMNHWIKQLPCAVTVCDRQANIIYMNDRSEQTFKKDDQSLIGTNLKACHSPSSWSKIEEMLDQGTTNSYTIEKNGVRKIIHQMPWYDNDQIGGLVEISIIIPEDMAHHRR